MLNWIFKKWRNPALDFFFLNSSYIFSHTQEVAGDQNFFFFILEYFFFFVQKLDMVW